MDLNEYINSINNKITKTIEQDGVPGKNAFLSFVKTFFMDHSIAEGFVDLPNATDVKAGSKLLHIDGYSFDEIEKSLSLYILDYYDDFNVPQRLNQSTFDKLYWKLFYFLEVVCSDNMVKYLPDQGEIYRAAIFVKTGMSRVMTDPDRILKIHFVIVSNRELDTKLINQDIFGEQKRRGKAKNRKKVKTEAFQERPVDIDFWPIDRFFEVESIGTDEPIEIDLDEYGCEGIPCIKGMLGDNLNYDAYIGIIPGKVLADIYIDHGSRILEGNVRAFLGTKSAKGVNSGIKKTINNDPTNFFTYNNGIAATASSIEINVVNGQLCITHIVDFQIINGGQTTATLAEAVLKKTNPLLEGIFVPIKLTVIQNREQENEDGISLYDQMIHDIARFANSQNKVTAADLFSNDPFHIWMEKASKKYLANSIHYNIQTGWYYERSRKKYQQEQIKLSLDEQKRFQAKFPKKQIISKEQLALYLTALSGQPHLCAKGKNWVMKEFGSQIGELYKKDKSQFNEYYYKKCVCAAIIYQTIDEYLEKNKKDPEFWYSSGGYKGNIVPYSIARIVCSLPKGQTFNWMKIWDEQGLSNAFLSEIARVTFLTNSYFCDLTGVLVSEHCKKESTWKTFLENYDYQPDQAFLSELISEKEEKEQSRSAANEQKSTNQMEQVLNLIKKGSSYWKELLTTGKNTNNLSNADQYYLSEIINTVENGEKGILPKITSDLLALVNHGERISTMLNSEGISTFFDMDDDVYEIKINDYKMHK